MKSPFLPLAVSCAIVLSSLGSALADKYSDFFNSYAQLEKNHDYEAITQMTLPADLDTFKKKAVEAYKRGKAELAAKGETRSLTVTTFPDLETLENLRPEDVYLTFRKRLAPPEDAPRLEYKYIGFHQSGDVGVIEMTAKGDDGGAEEKSVIYIREADGKIFLRLPDMVFADL